MTSSGGKDIPRHLRKGRDAERRARRHLERQGLGFVEQNYRCPPGEIDLIMRAGATIVFVEVRYRSNRRFGGALESIDQRKQRKMRAAAAHWLQRRRAGDSPCRFDVVLVTGGEIEWIANAM